MRGNYEPKATKQISPPPGIAMPLRFIFHRTPWQLVLIFLILIILISLVGLFYYEGQKKEIKRYKQDELLAIADLKVSQIENWRKERLGDAATILDNFFLAPQIERLLRRSTGTEESRNILAWMESFKETYQYKDILFLDKDGTILLSVAGKSEVIGPYAKKLVSEALRTRKIIFSDLYRNKVTGDIHLSIVVPILSEDRKDTLGVFLLRVDPYLFLYPLIEKWPTPSRTAETMLVRREGSEVVYLNDVRHQKGTALTLRLPMSNPYLPAAVAAMGKEGIFEGVDYRGREVLAALRSIPDSSWIIISKVDKEEVYAPIRGDFWNVTLVIGLCIFSAGASVLLIWRKREEEGQKKYLRHLEDTVKLRTEELDQAYKQLKESYKDLESFSYSVSHDLRAPLRIIRSLSEIVLNDNNDKLSDEDKKLLNSIQGHAKRMDKLVLALLDLSKIGRQDMRIDEIDIAKEAALIWADLKVAAPDRNITVTIPDLPTAYGDITLIRQVISNLLSNAIKFTSAKDVALIEVGYKRGDIEDVYYVKDNGAGFDMKYADKLFGVFQRLHSTKEFEGTGIGLSTVERIIRRHGGRVWADGRPNEGATFYFALPRKVN